MSHNSAPLPTIFIVMLMLDLCILLLPSPVHCTSRHRQETKGRTDEQVQMSECIHARTRTRTRVHMIFTLHARSPFSPCRHPIQPPFRPWSPSRGSIGWLGSLSRRQRRQRNALSLLAFALPLPCLALPCLACLVCFALPCLRLLPRLSCMFFFLLVSRLPNSYRPARRVHAQIFFLSL